MKSRGHSWEKKKMFRRVFFRGGKKAHASNRKGVETWNMVVAITPSWVKFGGGSTLEGTHGIFTKIIKSGFSKTQQRISQACKKRGGNWTPLDCRVWGTL